MSNDTGATATGKPENVSMKNLGGQSHSESTVLVEKKRKVSPKTAEKLRVATLVISWITVILLGGLGICTLVVGVLERSSASFAFALDALLDCLSSVVVIWRFLGNSSSLYSSKKEKVACIVLGILFCVSSVVITTRSAISFSNGVRPKRNNIIWSLSIANGVICLILVVAKSYLANKLESVSIATDAVNSGIGTVLAFSTLIGDLVYSHSPRVWYLDAIIGIICALFMLAYGIWVIAYESCIATHSEEESAEEDDS